MVQKPSGNQIEMIDKRIAHILASVRNELGVLAVRAQKMRKARSHTPEVLKNRIDDAQRKVYWEHLRRAQSAIARLEDRKARLIEAERNKDLMEREVWIEVVVWSDDGKRSRKKVRRTLWQLCHGDRKQLERMKFEFIEERKTA